MIRVTLFMASFFFTTVMAGDSVYNRIHCPNASLGHQANQLSTTLKYRYNSNLLSSNFRIIMACDTTTPCEDKILGNGTLVNEKGYILTAAHIFTTAGVMDGINDGSKKIKLRMNISSDKKIVLYADKNSFSQGDGADYMIFKVEDWEDIVDISAGIVTHSETKKILHLPTLDYSDRNDKGHHLYYLGNRYESVIADDDNTETIEVVPEIVSFAGIVLTSNERLSSTSDPNPRQPGQSGLLLVGEDGVGQAIYIGIDTDNTKKIVPLNKISSEHMRLIKNNNYGLADKILNMESLALEYYHLNDLFFGGLDDANYLSRVYYQQYLEWIYSIFDQSDEATGLISEYPLLNFDIYQANGKYSLFIENLIKLNNLLDCLSRTSVGQPSFSQLRKHVDTIIPATVVSNIDNQDKVNEIMERHSIPPDIKKIGLGSSAERKKALFSYVGNLKDQLNVEFTNNIDTARELAKKKDVRAVSVFSELIDYQNFFRPLSENKIPDLYFERIDFAMSNRTKLDDNVMEKISVDTERYFLSHKSNNLKVKESALQLVAKHSFKKGTYNGILKAHEITNQVIKEMNFPASSIIEKDNLYYEALLRGGGQREMLR